MSGWTRAIYHLRMWAAEWVLLRVVWALIPKGQAPNAVIAGYIALTEALIADAEPHVEEAV